MKSITKFFALAVLSMALIFTGEMSFAKSKKSSHHGKSKTVSHKKSAKKTHSKKTKRVTELPEKPSRGYAKAATYMNHRSPASATKSHGKKKHKGSTKKSKASKKRKTRY